MVFIMIMPAATRPLHLVVPSRKKQKDKEEENLKRGVVVGARVESAVDDRYVYHLEVNMALALSPNNNIII